MYIYYILSVVQTVKHSDNNAKVWVQFPRKASTDKMCTLNAMQVILEMHLLSNARYVR